MKDAYYFTHDSNARHDPKITAMRGVYGSEGYGWYWMLIELMREADGYKLDMHSRYAFNAFAMQLHSDSIKMEQFVRDCINEFTLFTSDGFQFWSESLLRRMKFKEEKSEKARLSASKRWQKSEGKANASKTNANASENDALKERKVNEIKVKEIKEGVHSPSQVTNNPHEQRITDNLQKYAVRMDKPYETEQFFSYIGAVDIEVIEAAIKKSSGRGIDYCLGTLKGLIRDGVTKESLMQKVGENSEKPSGLQHERSNAEDKPITGGQVGWLPSKYNKGDNVVQLPNVSG